MLPHAQPPALKPARLARGEIDSTVGKDRGWEEAQLLYGIDETYKAMRLSWVMHSHLEGNHIEVLTVLPSLDRVIWLPRGCPIQMSSFECDRCNDFILGSYSTVTKEKEKKMKSWQYKKSILIILPFLEATTLPNIGKVRKRTRECCNNCIYCHVGTRLIGDQFVSYINV